jgi:ABC-type transport system substrate-binding protein
MQNYTILLLLNLVTIVPGAIAMSETSVSHEVRTYMSYTVPIDPAKMVTIPDMDLSYALGSTLVGWDSHKEISAAVASSWKIIGEDTFRFQIQHGLKWSDGSAVTASDIKASFERALGKYPDDLRSLSNILKLIRCPTIDSIDFVLTVPAKDSNLLGKLTEPNYGILKITAFHGIDLSKSTGAFYILDQKVDEVTLKKNPYWFKANSEMPDRVVIRIPDASHNSETILLKDKWPNLVETSSMINADILQSYKNEHYQVWNRPYDKMGLFQINPNRSNERTYELVRFLRKSFNKKNLFQNLSGIEVTDQAFPKGYKLYDPKFKCDDVDAKLPDEYRKRPIQILLSSARINNVLRNNIEVEIQHLTGLKPEIISIPLQDVGKRRKQDDYDFYAGTIGMADPDPEGIMSYYFEGDLPMVPTSTDNYVKKLDTARLEKNNEIRYRRMSKIMTEATCKGHVLPLFHVSTIGIGRKELDFSEVPTTDESITLSKIRFKWDRK